MQAGFSTDYSSLSGRRNSITNKVGINTFGKTLGRLRVYVVTISNASCQKLTIAKHCSNVKKQKSFYYQPISIVNSLGIVIALGIVLPY